MTHHLNLSILLRSDYDQDRPARRNPRRQLSILLRSDYDTPTVEKAAHDFILSILLRSDYDTASGGATASATTSFNPTEVRLRQADCMEPVTMVLPRPTFNPTEVRLRHGHDWSDLSEGQLSILLRSDYDGRRSRTRQRARSPFNPTEVRLRLVGAGVRFEQVREYRLSILLRSDYDRTAVGRARPARPLSILLRSDYDLDRGRETAGMQVSFNPTEVRLRPSESKSAVRQSSTFNPTEVRLRLSPATSSISVRSPFNPTEVRLRRGSADGCDGRPPAFNPTEVRLRPTIFSVGVWRDKDIGNQGLWVAPAS